jgi:hypothetical protein
VVGEPALKLSLVPLVVSCAASWSIRMRFVLVGVVGIAQWCRFECFITVVVNIGYTVTEDLPPLPESQSAVAVWVARATVARVARENFMVKCVRCG